VASLAGFRSASRSRRVGGLPSGIGTADPLHAAQHQPFQLVGWAAREGWNPGLNDAELFWATDPEAFIASDLDGEMIGAGAITSYGGEFGFMGFFIVRPEFRSKGLGNTLWHARRERLIERLRRGATIGMDGLCWGSDYPHTESTFPRSRQIMTERLRDAAVPQAEQRLILRENVARLYGFGLGPTV